MVQITWLGHSTFQLRLDSGDVIVLDPWLDNPKYPANHTFSRVDAILVSHGHGDHMGSAVTLARQFPDAVVVGIYEVCLHLKSKGVEKIAPMNKGGTQGVGSIQVSMTHALHSSGIEDDGAVIYGGDPAGYVLHFPPGRTAYFAGDTGLFGDMQLIEQLYHPELAFLPIGDLFTMDPRQAAMACRMIKPKKVIPMHYGTFPPLTGRPEQLKEQLRDLPGTEVWTLEPGVPVEW